MAGNAGEIDAEKQLAEQDREFVVRIELVNLSQVVAIVFFARFAFDVLAHDGVGGGHDKIALAGSGDQAGAQSS